MSLVRPLPLRFDSGVWFNANAKMLTPIVAPESSIHVASFLS